MRDDVKNLLKDFFIFALRGAYVNLEIPQQAERIVARTVYGLMHSGVICKVKVVPDPCDVPAGNPKRFELQARNAVGQPLCWDFLENAENTNVEWRLSRPSLGSLTPYTRGNFWCYFQAGPYEKGQNGLLQATVQGHPTETACARVNVTAPVPGYRVTPHNVPLRPSDQVLLTVTPLTRVGKLYLPILNYLFDWSPVDWYAGGGTEGAVVVDHGDGTASFGAGPNSCGGYQVSAFPHGVQVPAWDDHCAVIHVLPYTCTGHGDWYTGSTQVFGWFDIEVAGDALTIKNFRDCKKVPSITGSGSGTVSKGANGYFHVEGRVSGLAQTYDGPKAWSWDWSGDMRGQVGSYCLQAVIEGPSGGYFAQHWKTVGGAIRLNCPQ